MYLKRAVYSIRAFVKNVNRDKTGNDKVMTCSSLLSYSTVSYRLTTATARYTECRETIGRGISRIAGVRVMRAYVIHKRDLRTTTRP